MASRGGSGGIIAAVVAGVLAAVFFVLCLVLWGAKQTAEQNLAKERSETAALVKEPERNRPEVRALTSEATKANQSLTMYLRDQSAKLAEKITGNAGDTPASLLKSIESAVGTEGGSLVARLNATRADLTAARTEAAASEAARISAESKAAELDNTLKGYRDSNAKIAAGYQTTSEDNTKRTAAFGDQVGATIKAMNERLADVIREFNDEKVALSTRLAAVEQEKQVLESQLRELRGAKGREQLRPTDEFALVDGKIVAIDPSDPNVVFIDRGRKDHIVLGMTFEVYSSPSDLIADRTSGEYRLGKAALEVIRIDQDQAMCRAIRPRTRADLRRGDVIVNAIYDPKKTYTFLVAGNFDAQGYGVSTPEGASEIKALINGWGGKLANDFRGDVDFIVLGARPVVPPQPPPDAPIGPITEYLRLNKDAESYDALYRQAVSTSIPVLNQNRLFTLIGR
ncbi:hypothetical protein BH11PLA1_BH11PLA1_00190 [soil metagenome]